MTTSVAHVGTGHDLEAGTFAKWCGCLLVLLLPGSFIVLAFLWFFRRHARRAACAALVALTLSVAGCGGPKVLTREAPLLEGGKPPLAEAGDSRVAVALDTVVVRNGPQSWASEANWDEYRLRIRSLSGDELRLARITVFDALGHAVESSADRGGLIDATREVERRYEASGELVRAGAGGEWKLAGGAAAASAVGGLLGAASAPAAFTGIAATAGALTVGAAFVVGVGVVKIVNNAQISTQLERRQTPLPAVIGAHDLVVAAFFPIVSLPTAIELSYVDHGVERRVRIETRTALAQIHVPRVVEIVRRPEPRFPAEAARLRIEKGWVRAVLTIDGKGDVSDVTIVDATSPEFIDEAKRTFRTYSYKPGEAGSVDETMRFARSAFTRARETTPPK